MNQAKVLFECKYCGHRWAKEMYLYNIDFHTKNVKCEKCGDKSVKFKKSRTIDTYAPGYRPEGFTPIKEREDE